MRLRRAVLAALAVAALATAGCGSVDNDDEGGGGGDSGPLNVGLVIPQSGVYAPIGEDMKAGWDLYLKEHGNKIGGRDVKTTVVDEGEGPDTGVPAVQKLLQSDIDVIVGVVNSATALGVQDAVTESKKLLVIANAGAAGITGATPYIWRVSFTNEQPGFATGKYAATTPEGKKGMYALAADYAAGEEAIAGFKRGFEAGGGKIVGEGKTPFGTTEDFQPYLAKVRSSGAGAVFVFYAGAEAVSFVKQYDQFGLKDSVALFGSGFLTEGGVLQAQGKSALGVRGALHYSTTLDNEANKTFAPAYEAAAGRPATVFSVQTWDAALVLDKAISQAGATDGDSIAKALDGIGEIADSPRGPWSFQDRSPKQTMYMREVTEEGGALTNTVIEPLGEFPPKP